MSMNSTMYQRWMMTPEENAQHKEATKRNVADRELFEQATDYDTLPERIKAQFGRATFDRLQAKKAGK